MQMQNVKVFLTVRIYQPDESDESYTEYKSLQGFPWIFLSTRIKREIKKLLGGVK